MLNHARLAGLLYLLTIVCGVFAEAFVRGRVRVRDDAAATAANILANESFYLLGLAADLIMLLAYVGVTRLFYLLFEPVRRSVSLLAAYVSLTGIVVLAVNVIYHIAALVAAKDGHAALSLLFLRLHARGYNVSGFFFGPYCILIGWLIYRSGFLPRALGVLMAIGGASYAINAFAVFLAPALAARLPDIMILGGAAELALGLWLLIGDVGKKP